MAYVTEAALKASCGKVGGDFVGGSGTGTKAQCSRPCGTGQCIVECDAAKKTCVGTTPPHQQRLTGNQSIRDILSGGKKAADWGEDGGAGSPSGDQQPDGSVLSGQGSDAGGSTGHIGNGNSGVDFGQWHASDGGGGTSDAFL